MICLFSSCQPDKWLVDARLDDASNSSLLKSCAPEKAVLDQEGELELNNTFHCWTHGWRPSGIIVYDGQQTSKSLVLRVQRKIASLAIVNKWKNHGKHGNPWKYIDKPCTTTRNHEQLRKYPPTYLDLVVDNTKFA